MAEQYRADILVSCVHDPESDLILALEAEIQRRGLEGEVRVVESGCRGFCSMGPTLLIEPDDIFYVDVKSADVPELVEETLVKGRVVERLTYQEPTTHACLAYCREIPFYNKQERIVLRHCGMIDPESIEDYIAVGGYQALGKVLTSMTPEEVIDAVKKTGLRGRGGAGFSTGRKWESARRAEGEIKYVLANGDEGDPNCFMDRALMEADPHSIIEGMIIGAYAVGAHQGFLYLPFEHTQAVRILRKALEQAQEYGLLGEDILGSGFDLKLELRLGAHSFVDFYLRKYCNFYNMNNSTSYIHITRINFINHNLILKFKKGAESFYLPIYKISKKKSFLLSNFDLLFRPFLQPPTFTTRISHHLIPANSTEHVCGRIKRD